MQSRSTYHRDWPFDIPRCSVFGVFFASAGRNRGKGTQGRASGKRDAACGPDSKTG